MNRRRRDRRRPINLSTQRPDPRRAASSAPADLTQLAQAAPSGSGAATKLFLHYRGDHRAYDPKLIVGPDTLGACYSPVSAEYDAGADRTTIYFRSMPARDVPFDAQFPYSPATQLRALTSH